MLLGTEDIQVQISFNGQSFWTTFIQTWDEVTVILLINLVLDQLSTVYILDIISFFFVGIWVSLFALYWLSNPNFHLSFGHLDLYIDYLIFVIVNNARSECLSWLVYAPFRNLLLASEECVLIFSVLILSFPAIFGGYLLRISEGDAASNYIKIGFVLY